MHKGHIVGLWQLKRHGYGHNGWNLWKNQWKRGEGLEGEKAV